MNNIKFFRLLLIFASLIVVSCATPAAGPQAEFPENIQPDCLVKIKPETVLLNDETVNLAIDIRSHSYEDTLVIYRNGEKIYECSQVVADPLTGEGDNLNLPISRDGELFRFESVGQEAIWEGQITPSKTEIYRPDEEAAYENYFAIAVFTDSGNWIVKQTDQTSILE